MEKKFRLLLLLALLMTAAAAEATPALSITSPSDR